MFKLPPEFSQTISEFSTIFTKNVFNRVGQLLLGTILTRGNRTVCSVLRTLGLQDITDWSIYHRVLSRAKWSPLAFSFQLLGLLNARFSKSKTLVFVMDETIERRWGKKIKARGIYRDAVRSSKDHFVKCSGLRWISVMLVTPISWANQTWALPFLTVLAPSERYYQNKGVKHKRLSDWARQICFQLSRWLPDHKLIMLGDGSYAVMELLTSTRKYVTWITRFRMDPALYDFASPRRKGQLGRTPLKGKRQPSLKDRLVDPIITWRKVCFSKWYNEQNKEMEITSGKAVWYRAGKPIVPIQWIIIRDPLAKLKPIAIQSTDLELSPIQVIRHYITRWQAEVTFEELRAHLGVETQRQWSDLSILRSTPTLMALFSIITIWADKLVSLQKLTVAQTAWYLKTYPTFSDALASVRYRIWHYNVCLHSIISPECKQMDRKIIEHLAFMAARAA